MARGLSGRAEARDSARPGIAVETRRQGVGGGRHRNVFPLYPMMHNSPQTRLAHRLHRNCVLCGEHDPLELNLKFHKGADKSISLTFADGEKFQGYSNRLHGGIISMLFDAAMVQCTFAHNLEAVTGSLKIRYLLPVNADQLVTVNVRIEKRKSKLCVLKGTLIQDGQLKSTAEAKFWIVS